MKKKTREGLEREAIGFNTREWMKAHLIVMRIVKRRKKYLRAEGQGLRSKLSRNHKMKR